MPELRYRTKTRILADILRAVASEDGAKPTHIMYAANLSYERLNRYLAELEEKGLLQRNTEGEKVYFHITDKGRQFLSEFRKVEDFTNAFGLKL